MIIFKVLASIRVDHSVGVVCAAVLSSNEVLSGLGISGAGSRIKQGGWAMALELAAIYCGFCAKKGCCWRCDRRQ